jgi:hypothetical protein
MGTQVQTSYPLTQERGQVGALSRQIAPMDADIVKIATLGAGLRPGDAFKLDASNEAIKVTSLADSANAIGVIGFEYGTINADLSGGTQNLQGIEYAAGDQVKYYKTGYVYIIGGAVLANNVAIGFDPADHTWKAQANTVKSMRTGGAIAADGDIAEVLLGSNL